MVIGRRLGSQGHLIQPQSQPLLQLGSHFLRLSPIPTPYKELQELRLRRGSCPLGHMPHVSEEAYTTEHQAHGRGKGRHGRGIGRHPKRWIGQGMLTFAPLNEEDLLVFLMHSFLFEADCKRQL